MEEEIIDVINSSSSDDQIKWCSSALTLSKEDKLHKIPVTSKSKVWHAFRILEGSDSICVICGNHLKYDPRSISTFKYHLNKVHNLNLDDESRKLNKRRMVNEYFERSNQCMVEEIIFRWITNHNLPTTVLDHEELKELLKLSGHRLPNRKAYSKYIEEESIRAKEEIKKKMKESTISLNSDGWKSSSSTNYLGISTRIVTDDFDTFNIWGSLKQINESTAENIKNQIEVFKTDFEISNIEGITTDGAHNMTSAARQFMGKEGNRCYCHNGKLFLLFSSTSS